MATNADGSVVIEVDLNTGDVEKELARLKKKIFRLEEDVGENTLRKNRLAEELKTLTDAYDVFVESRRNSEGLLTKADEDKANSMQKTIEQLEKEINKVNQDIKDGNVALDYAKLRYGEIAQRGKELGIEQGVGKNGTDDIQDTIQRISALNQELSELQDKKANLGLAFGAGEEYDAVSKRISEIDSELEKCREHLDALAESGSLGNLANGSQIAEQRISELNQKLIELRERQKNLGLALGASGEYDALSSEIAEVSRLIDVYKGNLSEAEQRLLDISESAVVADQHVVDLSNELQELRVRQKDLQSAGVGIGHEEYDQILRRISEINQELRKYQDSLLQVEDTEDRMGEATKKAAGYMDNFGKRLKGILASAFIFNILSAGLRQFTNWVGKSVKTSDQARQAIAQLKGALLTLAQPIIEVIIPAFTVLVNILARVVTAVAQLVSAIFGKTLKQSRDGAKALYEEANAIKGVGTAADEASGSLAGFDEINTISTENSKAAGGGGISGDTIKPDFTGMIEGELNKIAALVGAALLAVGAILTFSGANIPLGIALMAAGAVTLVSVIATDWGAIEEMLKGSIGAVTAIISIAFLALGAILAFSGVNIPLGIALMALGALGLAAVVAVNWESLSEVLQGPIGILTTVVSAALLVLGAILAFSGVNIPLGIALMAVGALGLAAVAAVNWESLSEVLQGPIGIITAVVSTALLALGAILAFSGVNIPLGIALMAAGAIGLASAISANWTALQEILEGPIGDITSAISVAFLALGAILAFSGANLPLGVALLAVGAVGLATTIAANWDTMEQTLEGPVGAVTSLVSIALLALGAVLLFSGANIPLGLGLLSVGAAGLATSIIANWDTIQNTLQGTIGTITTMVSAALLVLGAVLLFTGANIPLGLGLMSSGAAGLATAIAANWDTITTSVGGTVQAITAILSAALLVLGVVLLFTGVAAPLGLGLMAAGAIGLAATIVPNWDFILEAIQGAWANLKSWWSSNAAKFFTLDYWADLGKGMVNGLINGLQTIWNKLTGWVSDVKSSINSALSGTTSGGGSIRSSGYTKRTSRIAMSAVPELHTASIPALAQGAVIPPNREFMAVLGDQRNGNNLEAPEGLLRKIVREESGSGGDYSAILQLILEAIQKGHIIMVDRRILGQTVTQEQNRMTRQSGRSVLLG